MAKPQSQADKMRAQLVGVMGEEDVQALEDVLARFRPSADYPAAKFMMWAFPDDTHAFFPQGFLGALPFLTKEERTLWAEYLAARAEEAPDGRQAVRLMVLADLLTALAGVDRAGPRGP